VLTRLRRLKSWSERLLRAGLTATGSWAAGGTSGHWAFRSRYRRFPVSTWTELLAIRGDQRWQKAAHARTDHSGSEGTRDWGGDGRLPLDARDQ